MSLVSSKKFQNTRRTLETLQCFNCSNIKTSTSVHKLRKDEQILYFLNPFIPLLYHIYFCYLYTNLLISFHLTLLLIHYPFYPYVIIHVPFPFICNLYPFILFRLSISLLSLSFYSYLFIPSAFSPIPLFLSLYPPEYYLTLCKYCTNIVQIL